MYTIKYTYFTFLFASICSFAQMGIGKDNLGTSVLLDFGDNDSNTNGIILPAVNVQPQNAANGTFVLDYASAKVKMKQNDVWVDLSDKGNVSSIKTNSSAEIGQGVVLGAKASTANGVLVLEHETKALVLPKVVNPDKTVIGPYPGMICYDTESKSIAVFDGVSWNYWK